jgi:hypothetical protein
MRDGVLLQLDGLADVLAVDRAAGLVTRSSCPTV